MSHFVVLVALPESLARSEVHDAVAKALSPFHEFECTGEDDQYVQDVDKTAEALEEFANAKTTLYRSPEGELHDRFDEKGEWKPEFSRPGEYGRRVGVIPPGWTSVEVPTSERESAPMWISSYFGWAVLPFGAELGEEHKYGRVELDAEGNVSRCIDRTNPNKKWDWWKVGGRWSGFFLAKPGADAEKGEPGVLNSESDAGGFDIIRKCDIDREAKAAKIRSRAAVQFDKVMAVVGDVAAGFEPWPSVRERFKDADGIDAARAFYHEQPACKALAAAAKTDNALHWVDLEDFIGVSRDSFLDKCIRSNETPFAYLDRDGRWWERGNMGWWGAVYDERSDWHEIYASEFAKVGERDWLVAVDCHI